MSVSFFFLRFDFKSPYYPAAGPSTVPYPTLVQTTSAAIGFPVSVRKEFSHTTCWTTFYYRLVQTGF